MIPPDQPVANMVGVGRFRAASYYQAGAVILPGAAAHTKLVVIDLFAPAPPSGVAYLIAQSSNINTAGWRIFLAFSGASQRWRFFASNVQNDITTQFEPGQRLIWMSSYDGTTARSRMQDGSIATTGGGAGFVAGTFAMTVGIAQPPAFPALPFGVTALLSSSAAALSDADMATTISEVRDNLEHGRAIDTGLSVFAPQNYWDAADLFTSPGAPPLASWTDRIGGVVLTRTGAPELRGVSARF